MFKYMYIYGFIAILFSSFISADNLGSFRVDSHAPIGVMGDHHHKQNDH